MSSRKIDGIKPIDEEYIDEREMVSEGGPLGPENFHDGRETEKKIQELTDDFLKKALVSERGREVKLLAKDGPLRQTVIALRAGETLAEHNAPPAASVFVLHGYLKIISDTEEIIKAGEIKILTDQRHSAEALKDTVFLLTTVTGIKTD